ncbi:MAG: DUF6167 family protein [Aeromicrobium sp.]|uniref:DUF6167 family protein n=1 Tax=Aeromicrobium sp. TaxID=1871063 RepID=UPI0025C4CFD2|nr:DUF6167 family protein [Aeromicrobium sp.]MCK5891225.1 hypothetical protein [Aeromicrobium sp.]MDF1705577.1 DUF6167 family protein [Aeromicrobium sp.]
MTPRVVWFVAGTAAGVYASVKARRAAYRLSVPGIADQAAALGLGLRELRTEVRDGMQAKQRDVVDDLYRHAALPSAPADVPELTSTHQHHPEKDTA